MSDWEITLIDQTDSLDDSTNSTPTDQMDLKGVMWHFCDFIFSDLTNYIYCSTLISTIILRVLIILLFALIVITNAVIIISNINIVIITILFPVLISFKILFIYFIFLFFAYLFN